MWAAIIYVPFLQTILKTSYLEWKAMASILVVTAGSVICIELIKYFIKSSCTFNAK